MSSGKVLLGLVAGAAAGAVLGILFAPEKGSVTRKQIAETSEELMDSVKAKFDEFLQTAKMDMEVAKNEAEEIVNTAKEKVQEVKNDMKAAANAH